MTFVTYFSLTAKNSKSSKRTTLPLETAIKKARTGKVRALNQKSAKGLLSI
jgi:hypothetical protein